MFADERSEYVGNAHNTLFEQVELALQTLLKNILRAFVTRSQFVS